MAKYEKGPWPDDEWVDEKDICVSPDFNDYSVANVAVGEREGTGLQKENIYRSKETGLIRHANCPNPLWLQGSDSVMDASQPATKGEKHDQ